MYDDWWSGLYEPTALTFRTGDSHRGVYTENIQKALCCPPEWRSHVAETDRCRRPLAVPSKALVKAFRHINQTNTTGAVVRQMWAVLVGVSAPNKRRRLLEKASFTRCLRGFHAKAGGRFSC